MALETSSILQIDATIITGVLILLTVSSFADTTKGVEFIDIFREISTLVIIIPFAASAVLTLYGRFGRLYKWYRENKLQDDDYHKKLHDLHDKMVNAEMTGYATSSMIEAEIKDLEKQHEREKAAIHLEYEMDNPSPISIILMIVGFGLIVLLLSIVVGLEMVSRLV